MREFLKSFGTVLCTSAVLCAVLATLTPAKHLGKTVRTVIGVLMTLVVAWQIAAVDFAELADELEQSAASNTGQTGDSETYESLLRAEVEARVADSLTVRLEQAGVSVRNVEVTVHIDAGGDIYCDKASLFLEGGDTTGEDRARQLVLEQCGCEPEIYYEY